MLITWLFLLFVKGSLASNSTALVSWQLEGNGRSTWYKLSFRVSYNKHCRARYRSQGSTVNEYKIVQFTNLDTDSLI